MKWLEYHCYLRMYFMSLWCNCSCTLLILDHLETAEDHGWPLNDSSTCCFATDAKDENKEPASFHKYLLALCFLVCVLLLILFHYFLFVFQLVLCTTWQLMDYWWPMDHTLLWCIWYRDYCIIRQTVLQHSMCVCVCTKLRNTYNNSVETS
jgi:hypothetical protein